ncbi:hypothetical protein GW17_00018494 [Ensete ventricosum]|uniref:Uncharacterized protein n=1 Tax=Ensete ventricosum TaxID=4639 RepID=A0A444F4Q6_ENSVE|nr:hypothetical protein B296_00024355 [Ensete ventricosum]RWW17573.1 hypothetical protein GW17_00018494 [Ensete ventricosum]
MCLDNSGSLHKFRSKPCQPFWERIRKLEGAEATDYLLLLLLLLRVFPFSTRIRGSSSPAASVLLQIART